MQEIIDFISNKLAQILSFYYQLTDNYGVSVIILSISCSVVIYFLNTFLKKYPKKELEIQKIISPQLELIKNDGPKEKIHFRTKALYRRYSYNPIYAVRLLIPFIIQLPFLFSAYFMLLNFDDLKGVSFGIIKDLSSQDGLFGSINALPLFMTLVFILLTTISFEISKKEKKQSYFISLLFLFLLYQSPSALIIFWTTNSLILFILSTNYFDKIKKIILGLFIRIKQLLITDISKQFSLLLLILPYLIGKSWDAFFFNYLFFPSVIIIFVFDFYLKKINQIFKIPLLVFITFFFYSLIFYNDTLHIYHSLRFRYFSLIFILFSSLIFYLVSKFDKQRVLNIFLIVFSSLEIISGMKSSHDNIEEFRSSLDLKVSKLNFNSSPINTYKPIILIIVDELASSDEVFKYTNSDLEFEFDKFLIENDYNIKSGIKTHSKKTKISISSLLNYNLGKSKWIKDYEIKNEYASTSENFNLLIKNNLLVESLFNKGVGSYSFGKVNFSLGKKTDYYYLWENIGFNDFQFIFKDVKILKSFFSKSILSFIDTKLNPSSRALDADRKQFFDNLNSVSFKRKSFYMFHLDAPHPPFSYFDEFPLLDVKINEDIYKNDYVDGYISYRRFILKKIKSIISNEKFKNSRVIIIGDHGLRQSKGFDPYKTFGAFYGFNEGDIIKLKEIQDIGSLIDTYLN